MKALYALYALYAKYGNVLVEKRTLVEKKTEIWNQTANTLSNLLNDTITVRLKNKTLMDASCLWRKTLCFKSLLLGVIGFIWWPCWKWCDVMANMRQIILHWIIDVTYHSDLSALFRTKFIQKVQCSVMIQQYSSNCSLAKICLHLLKRVKLCRLKVFYGNVV